MCKVQIKWNQDGETKKLLCDRNSPEYQAKIGELKDARIRYRISNVGGRPGPVGNFINRQSAHI
ncbi:MAG: hypothetical protein WCW02_01605 [Candidatus Buchananbacteria bacterium]